MLPEKPWKLEQVIFLLLAMFCCFTSVWFVEGLALKMSGHAQPDESSFAYLLTATISMHGSILLVIGIFLARMGYSWREAFGFSRDNLPRIIFLGILAAIVFMPVGMALQWVSQESLSRLHVQVEDQQAVQVLKNTQPGSGQIYLVLWAILIAPVAEEALFRGVLYPAIKYAGYPRAAIWINSIVFAAIHLNVPTFIALMVLALLLTYLYEKTGNLLAPIITHASFNLLNVVMLYVMEHFHLQSGN